jgi:cobalt/nickel transport system permease protein
MTVGFDLPVCGPSFLQRMDARWKLAGVLLAALMLAFLRAWGPALGAFAASLLFVALARVPLNWYLRRMAAATLMYALFLVWLPFDVQPSHETLEIGFVTLSLTGLSRLFVLSANLISMVSLMLVMLATTPLDDTFKAARCLHLPRLLVLLMLLTYRYVFLLMEEFARLRTALRVRGFRNRANLHSYRTIGQVAGTLLIRSHERAERVGHAMACRGFDGEFRSLHDFHAAWPDVLAFTAIVGYAVGLLAWDWSMR